MATAARTIPTKPQKTAAATKIEDILDRPSNAAERPPAFPAGTFLWVLKGLPRYDKSTKKQTPFAEFTLQPIEARDDVDEQELADFGGLADKTKKATFYMTDASEFMLREFLDACGIPDQDEDGNDLSHRERIDQSPNAQVLGTITHKPSQDGTRMFAEITAWARVE